MRMIFNYNVKDGARNGAERNRLCGNTPNPHPSSRLIF